MGKVILDKSMSLDGYIAGPSPSPNQGLGEGGEILHRWAFSGDDRERQVLEEVVASAGAVICGRRTYDHSILHWGADGPVPAARLPVFIVTHSVPDRVPEGSVYTFVTDGIESALAQARAAAGDKSIGIAGANLAQQFIRAGLVDEINIHLVPVFLGGGIRLFDQLAGAPYAFEPVAAIEGRGVTHLLFRVASAT